MMGTAGAGRVVGGLEDMAALARVISDPKALESLRAEFAQSLTTLEGETAKAQATLEEAQKLSEETTDRTTDLERREKELADGRAMLEKSAETSGRDATSRLVRAQQLLDNAAAARAQVDDMTADVKRRETALDVASSALDQRGRALEEREAAVVTAETTASENMRRAEEALADADEIRNSARALVARVTAAASGK